MRVGGELVVNWDRIERLVMLDLSNGFQMMSAWHLLAMEVNSFWR